MTEEVATFGCHQSLVGILTSPPLTTPRNLSLGIIILGAGLLHRVGQNRLSVKIARVLGELGFTTLRFDFSGIGDSIARKDNLPYDKSVILEVQEAMDFFQSARGTQRFILLGHCTGATNSFEAARKDPRVRGIVLLNPAGGFARTARSEQASYYRKRREVESVVKEMFNPRKYLNPKNWWRGITGQIDYKNLKRILSFQGKSFLVGQKQLLPKTEAAFDDLYKLNQQGVMVQFVMSEGDPQVNSYWGALLKDKLSKPKFAGKTMIDFVDHPDNLFTSLSSQPQLLQVIKNFMLKCSNQENPS